MATQEPKNHMEKQSQREKKRNSDRKNKEYSIYSQKAVRAKEALIKKNGVGHQLPGKP